jgi:N-acetylmuramoyl-L-alanine amidase
MPNHALMKKLFFVFALWVVFVGWSGGVHAAPELREIRMWHSPERSRIVFDISDDINFNTFALEKPSRLVIDLLSAIKFRAAMPKPADIGPNLYQIRRGAPKENISRLVFDLAQPVRFYVQMLKPAHGYRYRLVVDLYSTQPGKISVAPGPKKPQKPSKKVNQFLVLIDPGHGGEDPGALGRRTKEKTVVLQIAKRVRDAINAIPGLTARLTRKSDYYISLRQRISLARKLDADLFISIHADAFRKKSARGASVYALSQRGASSESARWLANKENAADLAGGVSLADKEDVVVKLLLDLSMTNTISESLSFGKVVLSELKKIGKVHSQRVEQASFVVLKSPDIPSILIETGYITNPHEEKLLRSSSHQKKIAKAVANGVKRFMRSR